jgi:hypothetical protein
LGHHRVIIGKINEILKGRGQFEKFGEGQHLLENQLHKPPKVQGQVGGLFVHGLGNDKAGSFFYGER